MPYDPEIHHRRSIRLRGFDYRTPGLYVVTICTEHRLHLFGEVVDGEMQPSPAGEMVEQTWDEMPSAYPGVDIDAFVAMPNHVHGIVFLVPQHTDLYPMSPTGIPRRLSLSDVVERFNSLTTKRYGEGVMEQGWPPYDGRLWQRGYYDRIVRNEYDLNKFRRYIGANPARWFEDPYNPS
jgi:putative transposase